jgi:hypothetical protein
VFPLPHASDCELQLFVPGQHGWFSPPHATHIEPVPHVSVVPKQALPQQG